MSRSQRNKRGRALSEETRYKLALARPPRNLIGNIQQRIAQKTKPVLHQILEAETRARVKGSSSTEGWLERNGLATRRLKEELSQKQSQRIIRDKHDKHSDYVILSRAGKKRLRSLRYKAAHVLANNYRSSAFSSAEQKQFSIYRSRVIRILDGKSPSVEIFDAMIPLFELLRKRSLIRQSRAERVLDLIRKKVKVPPWLSKLEAENSFLSNEQKRHARMAASYAKKIAWLSRMTGRVEKGIDVSGATNHFIREVNDNLQDYFVTD
ncbi:MAG: hypothetical protein FJY86_04610 [Candidatus Diapherotrites archaeon]|uniref:Uncharacterized protein n=1 Tax=Candidatus Iainarchaeum sp. TaxID=3101447 RepID=A0A8T4CCD2_9ARCH|nr:hypothetical protein [Candidatus Diapherotrites archaeon]